MKALVWVEPGRQEIRDVPEPIAREGEVLVRPALVGICGSDVTAHKGRMSTARPGSIRGHEFGGTVASGSGGLDAGAKVAVNPVVPCGSCDACATGAHTQCVAVRIIGVHEPGALAELVAVPRSNVFALKPETSWLEAASLEPLANAVHMVDLGAPRPDAAVLVIGAGSIGMRILKVLRARGIRDVTVVEPRAQRHEALLAAGAARILGAAGAAEPAGYPVVFDVVGSAATRSEAIAACANGGTVVLVGLNENETAIPWHAVIRRELRIVGAQAFGPRDYEQALAYSTSGEIVMNDPFAVVPFDAAASLFDDLSHGRAAEAKHFVQISAHRM